MAAMTGKIFQNVCIAHYCQQNRQLHNLHRRDSVASNLRSFLPLNRRKSAWNGFLPMQLRNVSMNQSAFNNRAGFCCNAASSSTTVPFLEKSDFLKLQNGSDIRGVAVAGVDGEPVNLTEPVSEAIAAAFAAWLSDKKKGEASRAMRVSIGHDSRISATKLQDAVSRGLLRAGLDVLHFGLASTPAMFNSTLTEKKEVTLPVDGAIMITASHLPFNRNGFKFFTNTGGLGKADIKDILERASALYNSFSNEGVSDSHGRSSKSIRRVDYMDIYASDLVQAVRKAAGDIEKPLEGFHIVVDAGNGAGGFFVAKVLEPLGAITSGSQFLEPDGMFPNHIPNPEDKAAMRAITQAVLDNKADLGIIFDTDVDRSAAVDSTGRELNRNRLIALMSAIILEEHPGTTIVTDSVTSDGLTTFIEKKLDVSCSSRKVEATIKVFCASVQGLKDFVGEVKSLASLQHPNLCKLLGYHSREGSEQRILIYERLHHGSLDWLLYGRSAGPPIDWSTRVKIALCAAQGLTFLHEEGPFQAMYKEFSSVNIQMDKEFSAKLSGYGCVGHLLEADLSNTRTALGNLPMETVERGLLTPKSNVYSFGIVLIEILTGRKHMDSQRPKEERNIVIWSRPFLADECRLSLVMDPQLKGRFPIKAAQTMADIAQRCLRKDPLERPTMRAVVENLKTIQEMKYSCRFPLQEPEKYSTKQMFRSPSLPPLRAHLPSVSPKRVFTLPLSMTMPARGFSSLLALEELEREESQKLSSSAYQSASIEGF